MIKFKSQRNQLILLSTVIIFLSIFSSCEKEPDGLGLDVLPGQDTLLIQLDTSAVILANTVKLDSILSYSPDTAIGARPNYLIADYTDPIFGFSKSSLVLNFYPDSSTYNFGSGVKADSLVLLMRFDSLLVGDKDALIEFKVWELQKGVNYRSKYYSNLNETEYKGGLLATKIVKYNDTLRIKLNQLLADSIIAIPPSLKKDAASMLKFQEYFKGLYIEARSLSGPGVYLVLDPWRYSTTTAPRHDTRLTLHYQNSANDSLQLRYFVDTRVNDITHDYQNTPVQAALQDNEFGKKVTYVQGLGGVATQISIPGLSKWYNLAPVSINKAELIIPVDTTIAIDKADYPKQLYIKAVKNSIYDLDFIEYGLGQSFLNGVYDSDRKAYIFNLAKHIQKIANGKFQLPPVVQNTDLLIMADAYKIGQQNVFGNVALNFSKARLNVVYSKQ